MNVEFGTEAAQLPKKEYINGIFVAMRVSGYTFMWQKTVELYIGFNNTYNKVAEGLVPLIL
jgi:hypothetical protein